MKRVPPHFAVLISLTLALPALIAFPNAITHSGLTPPDWIQGVLQLAYPAVFIAIILATWLVLRRTQWRFLPATTPEDVDAAEIESDGDRGYALGCVCFAVVYTLFGTLTLFAKGFRLSMVTWFLGRNWWERDATILCGASSIAWGLAFAILGWHYHTSRHRWLAHLAVAQVIFGWLLLAAATWIQSHHVE